MYIKLNWSLDPCQGFIPPNEMVLATSALIFGVSNAILNAQFFRQVLNSQNQTVIKNFLKNFQSFVSAIIPSSEKSVAINDDEDINSDDTDDEAKTESACMMFIFVEACVAATIMFISSSMRKVENSSIHENSSFMQYW